ncbi:MAG: thiamine phosphate synthase [Spirochaetes bacterium]|nr:thiamine phosphate synthase [Spirochaetota bacterium]
MRLVVVTPESDYPREHEILAALFGEGLTHVHVRKPAWGKEAFGAWMVRIPAEYRPRLVLHQHHELGDPSGGLHQTERSAGQLPREGGFRSRAVHDLKTLATAWGCYDRVLLSPVFPSISKPGHGPDARLDHRAIASALAARPAKERPTEVLALGGVDATRIPLCAALGFDGVAVLGAVWNAPDPLIAFRGLSAACRKERP